MKILRGDKVKVLIGKDKGREGEVSMSYPKKNTLLVKGINMYKKHLKATKDKKGGIIEKEKAIGISKVALICPSCQKTTRVAYSIDKAGEKNRICKKCKAIISSNAKKK
jgi:large subunit ribosomal protein L24